MKKELPSYDDSEGSCSQDGLPAKSGSEDESSDKKSAQVEVKIASPNVSKGFKRVKSTPSNMS